MTMGSGVSTANFTRAGHLLVDGLDGLPPCHRPVGRVGQHCLRLVECRRLARVEPPGDQPCYVTIPDEIG
jgi:hypothetical protein